MSDVFSLVFFFFFFNDTATTEIYTLSLHDALPISPLPVIAALIPILVPGLEKLGYQRSYVTAVLCSSSFLGYLIPPSVPGLIYCLVAQQSVGAVFLSTVIPGLILAGGYIAVNTFICQRYYAPAKAAPKLPPTFL